MASLAAAQKAIRAAKMAQNLCTRPGCGQKPEPGKKMCRGHLNELAAYVRKCRKEKK